MQNRKYFGMTGTQIGILAGMALAAFCLFALTGYLALGKGFNFAASQQGSPTPIPTATLIVIPTITPTSLPTPIPYEQLIPNGWTQHRTALVEIWYPPAFKAAKSQSTEGATTFAVPEIILSKPGSTSSLYNMWAAVSYEPL